MNPTLNTTINKKCSPNSPYLSYMPLRNSKNVAIALILCQARIDAGFGFYTVLMLKGNTWETLHYIYKKKRSCF
jgi:hypothetical protein